MNMMGFGGGAPGRSRAMKGASDESMERGDKTPPWDVAAKLLPALLHDVNNATQLLVGLKAMLEIPGGESMFAKRVDDLARTSARMDDLGFALAVLSTAGGANMLMSRREARSIEILWDLALKSLQRDGGDPIAVTGAPPLTVPGALGGWEPAWTAAALLLVCAECSGHRDWSWAWHGDGSLHGESASGAALDEGALRSIAERAPGLVLEMAPGRALWRAPDQWLVRTASG